MRLERRLVVLEKLKEVKDMAMAAASPVYPHDSDADVARAAIRGLRRVQEVHGDSQDPVEIRLEPDEVIEVPRAALDLMIRVLGKMAAGQGVTVVPMRAELTTQRAADLLNVSRPYLIKLLEAGDIEYRKVGTHRRVMAESLYAYKRRDSLVRRDAADELTQLSQELGLL